MTDLERRLAALRRLQHLLDEAFRVPGTGIRFGWDPIIGLVPWVGDALTALLSCAIVVQAHQMRLPRIVQLRMVLNIGIDMIVGVVPLIGDAADVFWKSNTKNMALLDRHAAQVRPASAGDWLFVVAIIGLVAVLVLLPLVALYWIVHALTGPLLMRVPGIR
ncbi:MAG TPA: DUF4112 domain-containing protein [Vicinamibacterales bacterium]|nr:DUF4112 domain-containing protein [Vicinamibacterales bacterium]